MSTSLPSKQTVVVDVPEVRDFRPPQFTYNFFTTDETHNETGDPPETLLKRPVAFFDDGSNVPAYVKRLPRYVTVTINPVVLETDPDYALRSPNDVGLIRNNIDKIVSEEHFTNGGFTGVNFEPVDFDVKIYHLVSGTANKVVISPTALALAPGGITRESTLKASTAATDVPPGFLANALANPNIEGDISRAHVPDPHEGLSLRVQFDSKIAASAVATSLFDPLSTYNEDIRTLWESLRPVQTKSIAQAKADTLHHKEFDPKIQYLDVQLGDESLFTDVTPTRIIGYVIDKWETQADGTFRTVLPQIVVENPKATTFVDFSIKYGTEYAYAIRTIAEVKYLMQVEHDDGTSETGLVTLLVSSRPTPKQYVKTFESVPPPPPADLDFVWDYENHTMSLLWSLPVNTQQDIKKFQVFRRATVDEPFELIRLFDFDDSDFIYPDPENDRVTDTRRVRLEPGSPVTFYTDDDFTRSSAFIYAVASVDAHGLTSGYSQQYQVSYDRFHNKLVKRLLSPSGAPKPYPNFFLLFDTFDDVITGSMKQNVNLYFTPDALSLVDRTGHGKATVQTDRTSGYYYLQVINTDVQKLRTVRIDVEDRRPKVDPRALDHFLGGLAPMLKVGRPKGI